MAGVRFVMVCRVARAGVSRAAVARRIVALGMVAVDRGCAVADREADRAGEVL